MTPLILFTAQVHPQEVLAFGSRLLKTLMETSGCGALKLSVATVKIKTSNLNVHLRPVLMINVSLVQMIGKNELD